MEENVVMECDLYTYEAAVARYERERQHSWLCRQRKLESIRERQKAERNYHIKQKITGIILLIVSLLLVLFGIGEGFFILPIGIYTIATKKKILSGWDEE